MEENRSPVVHPAGEGADLSRSAGPTAPLAQLDHELQDRSRESGLAATSPSEQCHSGAVVGSNDCDEATEPLVLGTSAQLRQQHAGDAASVPGIDDRDRHLSRLGILAQSPVACDTERLARSRLNRDHRHMVRAVELSEAHEHGSRQPAQVS